jgi:hypothetical protein
MTQQEIFQNMTKGEWRYYAPLMRIDAMHEDGGLIIAENLTHRFDGNAAISAVNNTYGKGINPESAEKIKNSH